MEELRLRDDRDSGLVREALAGSERAFRKILEQHYGLIYSVVRGVAGQRVETDDCVQEVFIKIFRSLGSFRGEARLSTWIYRIARNEALNAVERRRPQLIPIEDCEELSAADESPETAHHRRITREGLERLIERLDERQRIALELRYMGDKSYEEIAEIMDIPLGTVKTYIHRAKLALKRMMTGAAAETLEKGIGES
jgi:RNA polymerase sigma-70 factor (ECF subfamily)